MISREAVESFVNQFEEVLTEISGGGNPYAFGERLFQLIRKREEFIEGMRSRDALIKVVESFPDGCEAVLPTVIALYKIAPAIFEQEIAQSIQDAASKNPVGAGRPAIMKSNEAKRESLCPLRNCR